MGSDEEGSSSQAPKPKASSNLSTGVSESVEVGSALVEQKKPKASSNSSMRMSSEKKEVKISKINEN